MLLTIGKFLLDFIPYEIKKTGLYNFAVLIYAIFILLPVIFFGAWWRLGKQLEKTYL